MVLVVIVIVVAAVSSKPKGDSPIKIGFIGPLSGDAAIYGEAMKNGLQLAVDEVNNLGKNKLEILIQDSKCSGPEALTAVQKLINVDGVKYILGAVCSGEVLGALPATEKARVVFMGQGSSPDITGKGDYFFRTWPSDLMSMSDLITYLSKNNSKISSVTEKTDYAMALNRVFEEKVKELGIVKTTSDFYSPDTKDFRSVLSKIKTSAPDVLLINAQTGAAASRIAKQAREIGISSRFATLFLTGDDYVASGPFTEGTVIVDFPTVDSLGSQKAADFVKKYEAAYGKISYPFISAQTYDQLNLLVKAINEVGNNTDRVRDYLHSMSSFEGVIGTFRFDEKGDVHGINFTLKIVEGGKIKNL